MGDVTEKKLKLNNWTLGCSAGLVLQVPTPISEKGVGVDASCEGRYRKNLHTFTLGAGMQYVGTSMKLLPTGGSETEIKSNHLSFRLNFGHETFKPRGKGPWGFTFSGTHPYIGAGRSSVPEYTRYVDGSTITVPGAKGTTFDIGSTSSAGLDILVGKSTSFRIGGAFSQGVNFGGATSEFNRVTLQAMIELSLAGGLSATSRHREDKGLSTLGLSFALSKWLHGLTQRYYTNRVLNDASEQASNAGLLGGSGNPGAMADVPTLQSIIFGMGGVAKGTQLKLYMSADKWRWLIATAEALGGLAFLFISGTAAKSGGISDILSAGSMGIYAAYKIDTPAARAALDKKDLLKKTRNAFLWRAALVTATHLIGAAMIASEKPEERSSTGRALIGGSMGNAAGLVLSPMPMDTPGIKVRTSYSYIPFSAYRGSGGMDGKRGGITVSAALEGTMLRTDLTVLSPMLTIINSGKRADASATYDDTTLPSEGAVAVGLYKSWPLFSIFGGIEQVGQFGGGKGFAGGLGGKASVELTIPIKGIKLLIGLTGRAHWLFPKDSSNAEKPSTGWQYEVAPYVGIQMK